MIMHTIYKFAAFGLLITWAIYANTNTFLAGFALAGAAIIVLLSEPLKPQQ